MADFPFAADAIFISPPLTVEELEAGLRQLDEGEIAFDAFWDEHLPTFRQAMVAAIDETSHLLTGQLPIRWRRELEAQLEALRGYVEIVDAYMARRGGRAKAKLN